MSACGSRLSLWVNPWRRSLHARRSEASHIEPPHAASSQRQGTTGGGPLGPSGAAAMQLLATTSSVALAFAMQLADPVLPEAAAVLSSPNAQIARSADAALRRSIPAFNPDSALVQKALEDIQYLLRIPQRKPWGSMESSLVRALATASERSEQLLAYVPPKDGPEGARLLELIRKKLQQLQLAIQTQQADLAGLRVAEGLRAVADLEVLQAPGLAFSVPKDYARLPRLVGRATVELAVEKKDGSLAFVDAAQGGLSSSGRVLIVVDGYSAPISAGNFVSNVLEGLYDGRAVQASYTAVLVPGKLDQPRAPIPLEILPLGQFDPVYRSTLAVQDGELPVLPLSIPGAISMAHVPDSDSMLSGDEWFIFKFDKQQAGLSGLAFDEGTFGVFAYVTEGIDTISKLQSGDTIRKAEVVSGREKLLRFE